jgi:hypothetical protein
MRLSVQPLCSLCLLRNYSIAKAALPLSLRKASGFPELCRPCCGYAAEEAKPQTRSQRPESQRLSARGAAKPPWRCPVVLSRRREHRAYAENLCIRSNFSCLCTDLGNY